MPDPFKNLFNPALIVTIGDRLASLDPQFDRSSFIRESCDGLDALELKARAAHITAALGPRLPQDFAASCALLRKALHPDKDGPVTGVSDASGLRGWAVMPLADHIAAQGLDHFDLAMETLGEMTKRFTCEFAVRPFLAHDPARGMAWMRRFAANPNAHVRRLASEGSRPRLPWAQQLRAFIADPEPVIDLAARLRDDPSDYVRRSVANALNDIAKDHPDRIAEIAALWLRDAPPERRRLVRHACRTLIKQGHPGTLAALGLGPVPLRLEGLTLAAPLVRFGGVLAFEIRLRLEGDAPREIALDYVIHHRKASGRLSPKVFKWRQLSLVPGAPIALARRHPMRPITTRVYHDGPHRLEIVANGEVLGAADFTLEGATPGRI